MARVLLVDPFPRTRLPVISALSEQHQVMTPEDEADPLRTIRRGAVDVVLISLAPGARTTLALVRAIRTDAPGRSGGAPKVGVYCTPGDPTGPERAVDGAGADGWLGDPALASEFVARLVTGPWPVRLGTFEPGLLRRIAHRLRRIGG